MVLKHNLLECRIGSGRTDRRQQGLSFNSHLRTGEGAGNLQLVPPICRASSDRTYPGGLPRLDRTSSQPLAELTTLILVPPPICEIARAADDGFSYTVVARVVS